MAKEASRPSRWWKAPKVPWVEWDQALGGRVVGAGVGGVHGRGRLNTYMDLGQGGGAFWAVSFILASARAHFWPGSRDLRLVTSYNCVSRIERMSAESRNHKIPQILALCHATARRGVAPPVASGTCAVPCSTEKRSRALFSMLRCPRGQLMPMSTNLLRLDRHRSNS